ncbi:MAG: hypothetical protein IPK53_19555 [bacterium]|nr:hypothetical protein [bacterium]
MAGFNLMDRDGVFQVGDGVRGSWETTETKSSLRAVDFFEGADVVEAAHDGGIIAGVKGGRATLGIGGSCFVLGGDLKALLASVRTANPANTTMKQEPRFGRNQVQGWPPFDFGLVAE